MKKRENRKTNDLFIAVAAMAFVFFASLFLFYRYIFVIQTSDFPAHIRHALRGDSYSLVTFLFLVCNKLTGTNHLIVPLMSLFTVATALANALFIRMILKLFDKKVDLVKIIPVSCTLLFICKLCIPEWSPYYYQQDSFVTQPWHNSTYIGMRLFGVLTLMMYFKIQRKYIREIGFKDCFLFFLFLLMTNLSKPNFVIVFAPVMLVMLISDFITTKTKSFRNAFFFGLCVLASCAFLIFQYKILFPDTGEAGGIAFSLSNGLNILIRDKKFILHLLLNYAFPIYVTCLFIRNRKKIDPYRKQIMIQLWAMAILAVFVSLFIVETGSRAADGNFLWGSPFFAYVLFMYCCVESYMMFKEKLIDLSSFATARNIYLCHVIFGFFYFVLLIIGYLSWGI